VLCPAVELAGNTVTVTCSNYTGDFTVDVTATGTSGLPGCEATATTSTNVQVFPQPTIRIQGPSDTSVCGSEPSTELTYTISTTDAGTVTASAASDGAACNAGESA
jgi:hypothetical protein